MHSIRKNNPGRSALRVNLPGEAEKIPPRGAFESGFGWCVGASPGGGELRQHPPPPPSGPLWLGFWVCGQVLLY